MANLIHNNHNNDYYKSEDNLILNSGYQIEDFQPTGLYRIREDEENLLNLKESSKSFNKNAHLLSKFSNESLYSFSYSSNNADYQKISSRLDIYNRNNSYFNGLLSAGIKRPSPLVSNFVSKVNNFISTSEHENIKSKFNHFLTSKTPDESKLNVPASIGNSNKEISSLNHNIKIIIEEEPEPSNDNNQELTTNNNNLKTSQPSKKTLGGPKLSLNINTQNLNINKSFAATPTICNYRSPLRISEQSQATITTDGNLKILTINDIFCGLIKNNIKNKIVGKSVIDILFKSSKNNYEDLTTENSNKNKDKKVNRFMESIKKFSEKHLKHQKNNIISIIQKDQEEAAKYGITLKSASEQNPDSPFFFSSPVKHDETESKASDYETYIKDKVLICGQVVRIVNYDENDEDSKSVSIWLKRKTYKNETDYSFYYIWVLEEVKDKVVDIEIDKEGNILNYSKSFKEVFGYNNTDVNEMNLKIQNLIPGIEGSDNIVNSIIKMKNFSGKSKDNIYFPISTGINELKMMYEKEGSKEDLFSSSNNLSSSISSSLNSISNLNVQCNQYHVSITSIPNISGIIVVNGCGKIKTFNSTFIKHLLGYSSSELMDKDIIDVMPHFWGIVDNINEEDDNLLNKGGILSASYCKKRADNFPISSALPENSNHSFRDFFLNTYNNRINSIKSAGICTNNLEKSLNELKVKTNGVVVYHKDGSAINVNIKMRKFSSDQNDDDSTSNNDENTVYAIWIMYSRNYSNNSSPNSERSIDSNKQNGYNKFREIDIKERIDHFIKKMDEVITPITKNITKDSKKDQITETEKEPEIEKIEEKELEYKWTKPVSINEFEIVDALGDGAYGVVKLAYRKDDPKQEKVVIKYIIKNKILSDFWVEDPELGKVPKELSILNEIKKKGQNEEIYIVKMIDYFEDNENFYLITKQHGFGMDLFDYVEFNKEIPEDSIKKMFYQVCKSIQFLHHNNIVHRDIKDENIIVDEDCNAELIDFGSSTHYDRRNPFDTFCGTIDYASPEVLTGHSYVGPPQDVWALGILLYILIYKENPYYNIDEIISAKLRVPFILSSDSIDLIKKLLNRNERARINIDKVLEHPWFNDINSIINKDNDNK